MTHPTADDAALDSALDAALRRSDPAGPTPGALDELVTDAGAASRPRRLTRRRRIGIGSTLAVLLIGGTALAGVRYNDYLLGREPYQGIEGGAVRTTAYITTVSPAIPGVAEGFAHHDAETCHIYVEFEKGITPDRFRAVDDYLRTHDLSDVGPRALRIASATGATGDDLATAWDTAELEVIVDELQPVVPGVHSWMPTAGQTDTSGPEISGLAAVCGAGIRDGQ
jgi:hypothetical protein